MQNSYNPPMALPDSIRASQLFSDDDRQFLERMFRTYPHIGANFDSYLNTDPFVRPLRAMADTAKLKRTGWERRGVGGIESVAGHSKYVGVHAISRAPEGINPMRAMGMGMMHDLPEAIATDFTPVDDITSADKHRLELLAAKVIFCESADPSNYELVKEYIDQQTPLSHWVHDVDKLDAVWVALQVEALHPEKMGVFKEFADYSAKRMKTDEGKSIMADLQENAASYRDAYRADFKRDGITSSSQTRAR